MPLRSEMNGGNIRLRMTLKINVGCLSLASEMNGGNIWLRMTLKINVGCLSFASEINGGNNRLRMTQKNRVEEAVICLCWRKGRTPTLQFYFCKNGCGLTAGEYGMSSLHGHAPIYRNFYLCVGKTERLPYVPPTKKKNWSSLFLTLSCHLSVWFPIFQFSLIL